MHTFMEGPMATEIINHPMLDQVSIRQFSVLDNLPGLTLGPIP